MAVGCGETRPPGSHELPPFLQNRLVSTCSDSGFGWVLDIPQASHEDHRI